MNRRELLKRAGLAAAVAQTAGSSQTARAAASDRIGMGIIGCGSMGTTNQRDFMQLPDVDIVALCDVYQTNLNRNLKMAGGKAKTYRDYRRLLEDKNVQAVIVATPEHWHALNCIDACEAGKDVYVEKPAAHNIRDGRLMVEAARRNKRIVQMGTQQRSGTHFQRAVKYVQDGKIGDVFYVVCWGHSGGRAQPRAGLATSPPPDLDFDMWLGPAPKSPYSMVASAPGLAPNWRSGYWDFWGGSLSEWGSHLADIALWGMKAQGPRSVVAAGGQFWRKEAEIPDTQEILYNYDTFVLQYSILSHNSFGHNGDPGTGRFGSYGIQFHGTKGTLFVDRAGYRLTPQYTRVQDPNHEIRQSYWSPDERQLGYIYTTETLPEVGDSSAQHQAHVRAFIDCVKTRKRPIAEIEDGHNTNTVIRLGNIAYRLNRRINWDSAKEQAIGDPEANQLALGAYRAPWVPKGL